MGETKNQKLNDSSEKIWKFLILQKIGHGIVIPQWNGYTNRLGIPAGERPIWLENGSSCFPNGTSSAWKARDGRFTISSFPPTSEIHYMGTRPMQLWNRCDARKLVQVSASLCLSPVLHRKLILQSRNRASRENDLGNSDMAQSTMILSYQKYW